MTVHIDLFWKDLSPKNPALLTTNAEFRTCPDELAFQASRKPIPLHYHSRRNFSALWEDFTMPGAEDDSRFAGSVPEFAAKANYRPGVDFRRVKRLVDRLY
jgi:hypothetical protein